MLHNAWVELCANHFMAIIVWMEIIRQHPHPIFFRIPIICCKRTHTHTLRSSKRPKDYWNIHEEVPFKKVEHVPWAMTQGPSNASMYQFVFECVHTIARCSSFWSMDVAHVEINRTMKCVPYSNRIDSSLFLKLVATCQVCVLELNICSFRDYFNENPSIRRHVIWWRMSITQTHQHTHWPVYNVSRSQSCRWNQAIVIWHSDSFTLFIFIFMSIFGPPKFIELIWVLIAFPVSENSI